jgi:hypothetical protein
VDARRRSCTVSATSHVHASVARAVDDRRPVAGLERAVERPQRHAGPDVEAVHACVGSGRLVRGPRVGLTHSEHAVALGDRAPRDEARHVAPRPRRRRGIGAGHRGERVLSRIAAQVRPIGERHCGKAERGGRDEDPEGSLHGRVRGGDRIPKI